MYVHLEKRHHQATARIVNLLFRACSLKIAAERRLQVYQKPNGRQKPGNTTKHDNRVG